MTGTWYDAAAVAAGVQKQLNTMAIVGLQSGRCFTVRGWSFAIMRNGLDSWTLLTPNGIEENVAVPNLVREITDAVMQCEADNAGWDFDPTEIEV